MKKYLEVFKHPLTQINVMVLGFLILVQMIHTRAHHSYEVDVHGYVHQFIEKNPDACPESDW
jgi:hypothetical protein|tara:strand:+ start:590 stop:775 length:186 start_codon:yes stop_codon:yes gene_type:complete